jgi:hypothetical protein
MNLDINLYPIIDDELYEKIGFFCEDYEFYYKYNGDIRDLRGESDQLNREIKIVDDNCRWDPNLNNLFFYRHISLKNSTFLFGEGGIADLDAVLGVAVIWFSKTSKKRGVFKVGEIKATDNLCDFKAEGAFNPGELRGKVNFQTVVYLKKVVKKNIGFYADSIGTILGTLDNTSIIIDGKGSVFPVVEVSEPSMPLWYVECNWEDPTIDGFDEDNVSICINKANKKYKLLDLEEKFLESPYLIEIIAGSLEIIINKLKMGEYWDEIIKGENLEDGSIGQAVYYFIKTFNWEHDGPDKLAISIRRDFENRMGDF